MSGVDPIGIGLNLADDIVNKIWPDPADRAKADVMEAQAKIEAYVDEVVKPALAQIDVDKTEATSASVFVAGWRPFIGWVCGLGVAYGFIVEPLLEFGARVLRYTGTFPVLDTADMMVLVGGLLGLGSLHLAGQMNGVEPVHPAATGVPVVGAKYPWQK